MTGWPAPSHGYVRKGQTVDEKTKQGLIVLGALTAAAVVVCVAAGFVGRMLGIDL